MIRPREETPYHHACMQCPYRQCIVDALHLPLTSPGGPVRHIKDMHSHG